MCRLVEALEVELKALSPALLTDPPPPLHSRLISVLQRQLFILYGATGPSTEGWNEA